MRLRALASALLAAGLAASALAAAPGDPDPTLNHPIGAWGATWVGTDDAGDWGEATNPDLAPVGAALGQDLENAWIRLGSDDIDFMFEVSNLPSRPGGLPEVTRYTWNFDVNGVPLELDGKFTNYSRGTCDPTSGQCPPPRVPEERQFILRGLCETDTTLPMNLTFCQELAIVQATFDANEDLITITIPQSALITAMNANLDEADQIDGDTLPPCTVVGPAPNLFGGTISAAPSAYLTSSAMPLDTLLVTEDFVTPPPAEQESCDA